MIPLYPPTSNRSGSMPSIKWRSLVHLVTPTTNRRSSFSDLLAELNHLNNLIDPINNNRRPSAPAILEDLRKILPSYMRRHRSTSVLLVPQTGILSIRNFIF